MQVLLNVVSMEACASKNYYFDTGRLEDVWSLREGLVPVHAIRAQGDYAARIAESTKNLRVRGVIPVLLEMYDNKSLVEPTIYGVWLHPDFDVVATPGLCGACHLNGYENFPAKLQDFSYEQLTSFSRKLLVPLYELLELRAVERKLAESNPDYRIIQTVTARA